MLRSRWLSTFTIIGAILIVLGTVGLILGPRFVYDPGQPVTGKEAWCYLVIGLLMVMNGVMTPPSEESAQKRSSPANGTGRPANREVPVSAKKDE